MGFWELARGSAPTQTDAARRITGYHNDIQRKIIYFFKLLFYNKEESESGAYANNLLFDKLDALMGKAYAEAQKQLEIPGIEAPEVKRILPSTAVKFNPNWTYVSPEEGKIKVQLIIEATGKLDETQSSVIAEFIDFFDENFDTLHRIVGEVIDQLIKDAVVKALESVKEEMPDRARALGVDESKKKRGIRILLGNRR